MIDGDDNFKMLKMFLGLIGLNDINLFVMNESPLVATE